MKEMFAQAAQLRAVYDRVAPHIHRTPVLTSRLLDDIAGCQMYFKCDNFQKGGSYKIRGATNAILQLTPEQKANGVATHSSGNFAQALSLAAQKLGTKAYIVMPENAPAVKIAAVRDYGGEIIICPPTLQDREQTLAGIIDQTGATPVHPSNDPHVIMGQATMTYELLQDQPEIDIVVTPIGGGGVGAGACIAALHHPHHTIVIGAEPQNANDAYLSLQRGSIQPSLSPDTIADGLRTQLGSYNFPIIRDHIDHITLVSEEMIIRAMRLVWERMKIIIEPSSAVTLAAILTEPQVYTNKKVGLIITGGNVDVQKLPFG